MTWTHQSLQGCEANCRRPGCLLRQTWRGSKTSLHKSTNNVFGFLCPILPFTLANEKAWKLKERKESTHIATVIMTMTRETSAWWLLLVGAAGFDIWLIHYWLRQMMTMSTTAVTQFSACSVMCGNSHLANSTLFTQTLHKYLIMSCWFQKAASDQSKADL